MLQNKQDYCDICKDLIPLVKDGVAAEKSREFVSEHIENCEECRREYDGYSALPLESTKEVKAKKTVLAAKLMIWAGAIAILLFGIYLGIDIDVIGSRVLLMAPPAICIIMAIIQCRKNIQRMIWVISFAVVCAGLYFLWSSATFLEHDVGRLVTHEGVLVTAFVCVIASYFGRKCLAVITLTGYNLGIVAGELFGQVSYDPGGGKLHNGWIIWILVLFGSILLGCVIEGILAIAAAAKKKKSAETA